MEAGEILVAMSLKSEKLSLLADVLSQLSSAKYADSCLVFFFILVAMLVNRCMEKGTDSYLAIQPLILPCFPDSAVLGLSNTGGKKMR